MNAGPPLTPEQFALLPHDDRGPALVASAWTLTAVGSLFLGLRVFCKVHLGGRGLWWDDWILLAAWVVLVIDAALATYLVNYFGYGKHSWDFRPPDVDRFFLTVLVRATLTITAIAWTKTAFAVTMLRLTDGWVRKALWFIIITVNLFLGVMSALLPWVKCVDPLAKSWTLTMVEGHCWLGDDHILNLSIFSGAWSAAADFVLALLPWSILAGLQMKLQEKIGVGIAMSMGVLAGIAATVKTAKLPLLYSGDLYDGVELVIWDLTEIVVCMVAACIPVLRVLIREVRSSARRSTSGPGATGYGYSGGGSRYGLGSQVTAGTGRGGPHHVGSSWMPGWKVASDKSGTIVSVTAASRRWDKNYKTSRNQGNHSSGDCRLSRDSASGGEAGAMNDDWSEMDIIAAASRNGDSKGGGGGAQMMAAGPGDIVRVQEVRVESIRESLDSTRKVM